MAHTDALSESEARFVDEVRHDPTLTYADLEFEGQARHVDEYRLAKAHEEESV